MPIRPPGFTATAPLAAPLPALLVALLAAGAGAASAASAPQLLYSDIVSGPNGGGEGDHGIYLSVFGIGFGSAADLGVGTRLLINGVEVAVYRSLGPAHGRPDIQQLCVQIGALGNPTPGAPLPISLVVGGVPSSGGLTFTVNPGRILFVDNVHGDDASAVIGDIAHPWRHVQSADLSAGAWGQVQAGDVMVMRGSGTPWTDLGYGDYFLRFRDKSGSPPTGAAGSGPIGLMGYPGEDVFIEALANPGTSGGAVSAIDGQSYPGMGQWAAISGLRIESGRDDGPLNVEILGSHWRVVNNELTAATAAASAKAAGITGNGFGEAWLGNHIHDVCCGPAGSGPLQNHGIYIDGDGSYEIAYNLIERIPGGSGFQAYVNGGNGSSETNDIRLHHNLIRQTGKHGINLADNTHSGVVVWDNVVCDTALAGLRFNSTLLDGARILHNTFWNTNLAGDPGYGSITADEASANAPHALEIRSNNFQPAAGTPYNAGARPGVTAADGIIANNLWFGGSDAAPALAATAIDRQAVLGNPAFVAAVVGAENLQLLPGSAAIDAVNPAGAAAVSALVADDYASTIRPQGAGYDIGAYEYAPATAPAISQVFVAPLGADGATISWITDIPADGQLEYGPTPAYGTLGLLAASLVTAHSLAIDRLAAGATYHVRVRSRDAQGDLAVSGDYPMVLAGAPAATTTTTGAATSGAPPGSAQGEAGGGAGGTHRCGLGAASTLILLGCGLGALRRRRWMARNQPRPCPGPCFRRQAPPASSLPVAGDRGCSRRRTLSSLRSR